MNSPLVTVLITTCNYGPFIEQAIDSVVSQEFPLDQVQIVVVDDGSTDDTGERVKKYGNRIEYFRKTNGGQASALNFGFEKARGEIIALLDADDFFLPRKLALIADAFRQDPGLGMVYHQLQEWHVRTGERRIWADFFHVSGDVPRVPEKFMHYRPQPASCISFRRIALDDLLPIPEEIRMLGDCYLVVLVLFRTTILAIPEPLAVYRIHGGNSYSTDLEPPAQDVNARQLRMWETLIRAMRKWLVDNGYNRSQPAVRYFLDRWTLNQEARRFQIKAPGRFRFFRHVVLENYATSPLQTWRLTVFNYLSAFSALFFGYERQNQMCEWRGRAMETVERVYRAFWGGRRNSHSRPGREPDKSATPDIRA